MRLDGVRGRSVLNTALAGTAAVLSGLSAMLLARITTTTSFGSYLFAMSAIQMTVLFTKHGFDSAAVRFFPSFIERGRGDAVRRFRRVARARSTSLSLLGALVVLAWLAIGSPVEMSTFELVVCAVSVPLLTVYGVGIGELRGLGRVPASTFFNQLAPPSLIAFGAVLVWVGVGRRDLELGDLLVVALCATLVTAPALESMIRRLTMDVGSSDDGETSDDGGTADDARWVPTSRWLMLSDGTQRALGLCDVIIVGVMLGASEAAIFAIALRLVRLIGVARLSVSQVISPRIAALGDTGQHGGIRRLAKLSARASLAVGAVGLMGVLALGERALGVFGSEYRDGWSVLIVLALVELLAAFFGPSLLLLTMTGLERPAFFVTLGALVLNVVVSVVLVERFGMVGAAWGTAVGVLAQGVIRNVISHRAIGVRSTVV